MHHKNERAVQMMNGMGIDFHRSYSQTEEFDYLMLSDSFSVPNIKHKKGIIFGPHISLEKLGEHPKVQNSFFNSLSPWLVDLSKKLFPGNNYANLPFPVDTERFAPGEKKGPPVLYLKRRDPEILSRFLQDNGSIDFKVYDYEKGYSENDFLKSIAEAPYAVWIGCHESQGFALQETLSCDTPIFVIDASSLKEEVGAGWGNRFNESEPLLCTSASYFDGRCGMKSDPYRFNQEFRFFLEEIRNFRPREFILETLSVDSCIKKWIDLLER